jgi:hypothetical protein
LGSGSGVAPPPSGGRARRAAPRTPCRRQGWHAAPAVRSAASPLEPRRSAGIVELGLARRHSAWSGLEERRAGCGSACGSGIRIRRARPCAGEHPAPCASVHLAPRSPRGRRAPRSPQAGANGLAKQASPPSPQIASPPRRGRRAHAPPVPRLPRGSHVPHSPRSCAGGRAKQLAWAPGSLPPLGPTSLPLVLVAARIRSGRRRAGTPKRMRCHQPQRPSCMNAPDDLRPQ